MLITMNKSYIYIFESVKLDFVFDPTKVHNKNCSFLKKVLNDIVHFGLPLKKL